MKNLGVVLVIAAALALPALGWASELKPETSLAWEAYVREAMPRLERSASAGMPFLWVDETPSRAQSVRQGEVATAPIGEKSPQPVAHGLIHDWIGAVFIPAANVEELLAVLHDYDAYRNNYKPIVAESKLVSHNGDEYEFAGVATKKILLWTIALNGEFDSHCVRLDVRRGYCLSTSTRIQEIQNYGQSGMRMLEPDEGRGYVWRIHSVIRFEERDGGVYLEVEGIALSRDLSAVRWLSKPVVEYLSRDAISTFLRQTRDTVEARVTRAK